LSTEASSKKLGSELCLTQAIRNFELEALKEAGFRAVHFHGVVIYLFQMIVAKWFCTMGHLLVAHLSGTHRYLLNVQDRIFPQIK
jgi:hypothetical protein